MVRWEDVRDGGMEGVCVFVVWFRVQHGHRVVIQLLCRQDTPSLGSVVLLQHPSRHYITQLESTPQTAAHTHAHTQRLHHTNVCVYTHHLTSARIHITHTIK